MAEFTLYKNYSHTSIIENYINFNFSKSSSSFTKRDIVICPNKGVQKWFSLEVCNRIDCFTMAEFYNLNEFVFSKLFNIKSKSSHLYPIKLKHSILKVAKKYNIKVLESYINNKENLATFSFYLYDLFNQYIVYRPHMILSWINEPNKINLNKWQKIVFLDFWNNTKIPEWIKIIDYLQNSKVDLSKFLKSTNSINIIFTNQLPPLLLDMIFKFSKRINVNFFFLNPSFQYWWSNLDKNSVLLDKLGYNGKAFHNYISQTGYDLKEIESEVIPEKSNTLLSSIRNNILNNTDKSFNKECKKNIKITSTSSKLNEIELLKERVQEIIFTKKEKLSYGKILVMAPDTTLYKEIIENQFGNSSPLLPYQIADSDNWLNNSCVKLFLKLLELFSGKFTLTEIMDFIDSKYIRFKFKFTDRNIDAINSWFKNKKLVWGIDEKFKQETENSLNSKNFAQCFRDLTDDFLFYNSESEITGSNCKILGQFIIFCNSLFSSYENVKHSNNLDLIHSLKAIVQNFLYIEKKEINAEHDEINKEEEFSFYQKGLEKITNLLLEIEK